MTENTTAATGERADILALLADQRHNFLITMRSIDDAQARTRTTVSDLTLGGLVKHLLNVERQWVTTILERDETATFDMDAAMEQYRMTDEETITQLLADYEAAAQATDALVTSLDDLDLLVPLATAPWAPERQWWTARRVLLHILRETAHHSGHADIIRESLDGANTTMQMGADAGMEF
ncbi:putative damage-inducible protein DinB [Rhodococcus sp. LBL1]|uniref:Damage-inducible protein DinB n=1 Tax=Prescottella agglutinans TaxID=1644129 RepID=A0ABT6MBU8_9NOCA|nr:DinB family protein [Prescottella agglutinans]MDH6281256.1 putative damage-inducible protein DinB [Prescottella agglutinans]MDH6678821.1 putative damage-inducible protein DinB [Rhodococcus sp. LBL1]MDH6684301.1 putative damage-inducible protein DinB [Rhodococcus sp. LBL2]